MPRTHLSTRSKGRKRAVDILFEAELRGDDPRATLDARSEAAEPPVRDFTRELVLGVVAEQRVIDERLRAVLRAGWSLERMPRVDRCIARLAIWELDHSEILTSVAVSEAIALAEDLSTDGSPAFLNGVLAAIASDRTGGPGEPEDSAGTDPIQTDPIQPAAPSRTGRE